MGKKKTDGGDQQGWHLCCEVQHLHHQDLEFTSRWSRDAHAGDREAGEEAVVAVAVHRWRFIGTGAGGLAAFPSASHLLGGG